MALFNSQKRAPILEGLKAYHDSKKTPFTVPAHKMGRGVDAQTRKILGAGVFKNDIPILGGVDDLTQSNHYQEDAEKLAADAWGADHCYFSTNGTSLSMHASMMAVATAGDKVIVPRNAHRSLTAALILTETRPVFFDPEYNPEWDLLQGLSPKKLDKLLKENPDAKAVFIVSPDYYGICSDTESLAKVCHKHDKPLIVDEAWGPHFAFHKDFPISAMKAGADISMSSLHKTALALGQSSVFLLKGKRISKQKFDKAIDMFETTSPSSLILASMDAARRQLYLHGQRDLGRALKLARAARKEISKIKQLHVLDKSSIGKFGVHDLDETKLAIDLRDLNVTGFEAGDWLWSECELAIELADYRRLMVVITPGDSERSIRKLIGSVKKLVKWAESKTKNKQPSLPREEGITLQMAMTPAQAHFAKHKSVRLEDSVDMIAGEMITPYPPGISRIIPGARLTQEIVDYLSKDRDAGMFQEDAEDEKLKKIVVVDTESP